MGSENGIRPRGMIWNPFIVHSAHVVSALGGLPQLDFSLSHFGAHQLVFVHVQLKLLFWNGFQSFSTYISYVL